MSLYDEYDYPDEWQNEPPEYRPGSDDDEDSGWPYPDSDAPTADEDNPDTWRWDDPRLEYQLPGYNPPPDDEDDPVETDDPYDMRGWE